MSLKSRLAALRSQAESRVFGEVLGFDEAVKAAVSGGKT